MPNGSFSVFIFPLESLIRTIRCGSRCSSNALLLHLCYRCMASFCQEEALIVVLIDVQIDVQN